MSYTPMTNEAASRIQSSEAKSGNGGISSGSFAARAQSSGQTNANNGGGSTLRSQSPTQVPNQRANLLDYS